jgi:hypothetical protein
MLYFSLSIAALCCLQQPVPATGPVLQVAEPSALGLVIELPAGPVREAWERRAQFQETQNPPPVAVPTAVAERWSRWAEWLERGDAAPLCVFAAADQRWDDAWRWWLASAEANGGLGLLRARETIAALVVGHALTRSTDATESDVQPAAHPGTRPAAHPDASLDALPAAIPDGALLRPALPPQPPGPQGTYQRCAMAARGLRIGAAVVDLEVRVELDGVQIDLTHVGGGACSVAIVLPTMSQFALAQEYVDWEEQPLPSGRPLALSIQPGDERHTLWGRFEVRPNPWPARIPAHLPAQIARSGLVIQTTRDDPRRAELAEFAAALARLTRARCTLEFIDAANTRDVHSAPDATAPADTRSALRVDLGPASAAADPTRDLKWLALVALTERWFTQSQQRPSATPVHAAPSASLPAK